MKRVEYFIAKAFTEHVIDFTWEGPFKTEIEAQRAYNRHAPDLGEESAFFIQKTTTRIQRVEARRVRAVRRKKTKKKATNKSRRSGR